MTATATMERPMSSQWHERENSAARRVTDVLEPRNWVIALLIVLGWSTDELAGVGWGLLAGLFAAVFPVVFVRYGIRRWQWSSRHVSRRSERLAALTFAVASDAAGVTVLLAAHAPPAMTGYLAGMLVTSVVITAITTTWKISVHCAVASAAVAMVSLAYGPLVIAGYGLVALVAWSRVALRAHTTAQVIAGVILGAMAGCATYAAAR
ncbi:MAG TPA: phosphatase PAP2 family protein [Trebonia sp.]|nr:phosphatase PAP2 family protein [Trebonia sp.]